MKKSNVIIYVSESVCVCVYHKHLIPQTVNQSFCLMVISYQGTKYANKFHGFFVASSLTGPHKVQSSNLFHEPENCKLGGTKDNVQIH